VKGRHVSGTVTSCCTRGRRSSGSLRTRFDSSGPAEERRPDTAGQLDRSKPGSRVQIILAALVDDPEITCRVGVVIGEDPVDLVQLQ